MSNAYWWSLSAVIVFIAIGGYLFNISRIDAQHQADCREKVIKEFVIDGRTSETSLETHYNAQFDRCLFTVTGLKPLANGSIVQTWQELSGPAVARYERYPSGDSRCFYHGKDVDCANLERLVELLMSN